MIAAYSATIIKREQTNNRHSLIKENKNFNCNAEGKKKTKNKRWTFLSEDEFFFIIVLGLYGFLKR